jgi:GT2 family glycosyltransferase
VVDNYSTDDTPEVLKKLSTDFKNQGWDFEVITKSKENVGFGRAVNEGARRAESEFVTILNNDTWVMKSWDEALIFTIQKKGWDMVSPYAYEKEFQNEKMESVAQGFIDKNSGKCRESWNSILMLFRTESLRKLGYFDERFFVTYEDTDLRERMKREGYKYGQTADCFIWHKGQATRQTSSHPSGYEIEGKRLFVEKWGFDPSVNEAQRKEKLKRKWQKIKDRWGYF